MSGRRRTLAASVMVAAASARTASRTMGTGTSTAEAARTASAAAKRGAGLTDPAVQVHEATRLAHRNRSPGDGYGRHRGGDGVIGAVPVELGLRAQQQAV